MFTCSLGGRLPTPRPTTAPAARGTTGVRSAVINSSAITRHLSLPPPALPASVIGIPSGRAFSSGTRPGPALSASTARRARLAGWPALSPPWPRGADAGSCSFCRTVTAAHQTGGRENTFICLLVSYPITLCLMAGWPAGSEGLVSLCPGGRDAGRLERLDQHRGAQLGPRQRRRAAPPAGGAV